MNIVAIIELMSERSVALAEQSQPAVDAFDDARQVGGQVIRVTFGHEQLNEAHKSSPSQLYSQELIPLLASDRATEPEVYSLPENLTEIDSFDLVMQQSARYPLLTKKGEVRLARMVQAGLQANERLGKAEYVSEGKQARDEFLQQQGIAAKHTFALSNLRLTKRWVDGAHFGSPLGNRFERIELFQVAYMGLEHAVEKFDPDMGHKFSTYATWWIRQSIQRFLQNTASTIRVSVEVQNQLHQLEQLEKKGLSDEAIRSELGYSPEKVIELREARVYIRETMTSLDTPVGTKEGSNTLGDFMPDERASASFDLVDESRIDTPATVKVFTREQPEQRPEISDELNPFFSKLESFLSDNEKQAFYRYLQGKFLTDSLYKAKVRVDDLMEHPAVRAELKQVAPVGNAPSEEDWRNEAACIGKADIYTSRGRSIKGRKEIEKTCGSCAVRTACAQFFETQHPRSGVWIDGLSASAKLKDRQAKLRHIKKKLLAEQAVESLADSL